MRQRRLMSAVLAFGIAALPVLAKEHLKPLSLSGAWAFRLDPKQEGVAQKWFETALPDRIRLPGTTDEAKLGIANTNKPTLVGLCRPNTYAGPAWYQREIVIPAAWAGKRITLLLERVHWETRVWIDGQSVGEPQESLVTPHLHELGALAPGKHRLTICVDNTIKFDLGEFVSIYSEHTQSNWNGIVGRIELLAHDPVRLADVQVYPDAAARKARVSVTLANASGASGHGSVSVAFSERGGSTVAETKAAVTWDDKGGRVDIELALGEQAKLWDEFHPNLYDLTVRLTTQSGLSDSRLVCFGLRDFGSKEKQFTVNGRPIYLRGDVDCAIFPLTGYPAMEVKDWRRIMRTVKSYGLNHLRFHSWTPPEAAFTAADEAGIIFQVEGPQANVSQGADLARDAFISREIARIQAVYGNHPSFCLLTMGNELEGKTDVLERLVAEAVQRDQRHLCSSVSNDYRGTDTTNSQFKVPMKPRGIKGEGTDSDFAGAIAEYPRPQISHEVGQWQIFPNFREMRKYTGVFKPGNFAMIRDHMASKGLLDLAPRYVEATGKHAALLYKEEVEVLLRTPNHAGIQLLSLRDYPGTGTSLVGILDPFWDSKGLITPEAFQRFCGPTVPLLRFPKRTWSEEESFAAEAELVHFGETDLAAVTPVWSIKDEHGRELAAGVLPVIPAKTGTLTKLGRIEASLAGAKVPCKLTVTLKLKGTASANDWEIWAYPSSKQKPEPPADIVVSQAWDEVTRSALASGKSVLLLADGASPSRIPGTFKTVFWNPVWWGGKKSKKATMSILCDPKHPALAGFPTEFYSNWQWFDLLNTSQTMVLDELPATYRPIVQVIDNFVHNRKLGNLFEARVGSGRLLVCSLDLQRNLEQRPAACQLLRSLYAYMSSADFKPSQRLEPEVLARLLENQPPPGAGQGQ